MKRALTSLLGALALLGVSRAARAQDLSDTVPLPATDELLALGAAVPLDQGSRHLVYLNTSGGTYTAPPLVVIGENSSRNETSAVVRTERDELTLPAFTPVDADDFARIAQCLRVVYARYDIAFTDVDPGNAPHLEVVLGGDSATSGFTIDDGVVAGVAPHRRDCSVTERGTAFVFTETIAATRFGLATDTFVDQVCDTAAHELGHLLGLEHSFLHDEIMSYHHDPASVLAREAGPCGEYSARACECGATQSSAEHVEGALGLRMPLDVTPPSLEAQLAFSSLDITASDDVRRVDVLVGGALVTRLAVPPFRAWVPSDAGQIEVVATDGAFNETRRVVDVGANDHGEGDGELSGSGCAAGAPYRSGAWAAGLVVVAATAARRRCRSRRAAA